MTSEKRKAAQREVSRRLRQEKRAAGLVQYRRTIKPSWKEALDRLLKRLEKGLFE